MPRRIKINPLFRRLTGNYGKIVFFYLWRVEISSRRINILLFTFF